MSINFNAAGGPGQGPLARVLAVIVGVLALVATFMFSLIVFAVLGVVVLAVWGYFWWKTRALRAAMRETLDAQQRAAEATMDGAQATPDSTPDSGSGTVIEGEAVRVQDDPNRQVR